MQEVEEQRETVADEPQTSANENEREPATAEAALEPEIVPDTDESNELVPATTEEAIVIAEAITEPRFADDNYPAIKAVIEAALYITDAPLSPEQIAAAVEQPLERVKEILSELVSDYSAAYRGLSVRELAGGFKMNTKPEYHESIRRFVKNLQPPLKLSLPALETLAVVAYKQPITAPEIMDVRGVQGTGVLKTLLDRKLIAAAGRKNVMGKPILYKTTREFLIQFGLSSLAELPTLKEFEELGRLALSDGDEYAALASASVAPGEDAAPEHVPVTTTAEAADVETLVTGDTTAAETTYNASVSMPTELKKEDTAEEAASEQQTNG